MSRIASGLVELAKRDGAVDADALAVNDIGENISIRNGKVETVEREDSRGIGLRAFVETPEGLAFASASSSDLSDDGIRALAKQVIAMAKISAADPDAMPPSGADHPSDSDLAEWEAGHPFDEVWTLEAAREAALACEEAALGHSDRIQNSEGAQAGFGSTHVAYASADGFCGQYRKSSLALSVSVIAGIGDGMQRDYAWSRVRNPEQLRAPHLIGKEAAERALRRLGSKSIATRQTTVIFEPRMATSLLGHLVSAINGRSVLQQRSFLADASGESIFPDFVQLLDDPDHPDGLGNRLFDGEGTRCSRHTIIDSGRLTGFLADRYTAARLGCKAAGHARRGLTGDISIGTSNLILRPGEVDTEMMLREIGNGVLVTEMMGSGINGVTGDYSRGAAGFLIENGKITRPVNEITVAGNLQEMFRNVSHLGSDLTWFGSTAVPSIAISGMTVAGQEN
ncbi:MAG: TldD/PmbA family protein [Mariprofundaceae bacterium]|nr:TldD/PmbA family protein [Mariprofundaceae bacterium]